MSRELQAHPVTALFPLMDDSSLRELAEDIAAHGLQHPVVMHEGLVLDGRNRLAACQLVNVTPSFVRWEPHGASPTEWVIATNLHRRHLTTGQRAAIAVEALPLLEAEAKERRGGSGRFGSDGTDSKESLPQGTHSRGRSYVKAARQLGIGHASVGRAKQLKREAPEAFEKVRAGEMSLGAALRENGLPDGQTPKSSRKGGRSNRGQKPVNRKRKAPAWLRPMTIWLRHFATIDDRKWLLQIDDDVHAALAVHALPCVHKEEHTDGASRVA